MKRVLKASMAGVVFALVLNGLSYAQDAAAGTPQKTIQLQGVQATLSKGLDAKKLKQGDPVTAKLQNDVKADTTDLPKNTVLVGHVDQVQASDHKSVSSIQVTFDKAQLKSGQEVPVKATIMKIAPPPNAMGADQGAGAAPMPSSAPSVGGGAGSSAGPAPAPQPSMQASVPDASSSGQPGPGSDVTVKSDIHDADSGTFLSKGKNVHLMDGTTLQLALAVVPAGTKIQ